jgi:hypothetical protein
MKKIKKTGAGGEIYSNKTVDVADELTKLLSEEWAKQIDKEILRGLGLEPEKNKRRINSINKIYRK